MEVAVADFVSHTGSEPGLARDILQSANWDIHAAYNIFNTLRDQSKTTGFATKRDSSATTAYFDDFDNPKLKGNLVSKRVEDSVDDRLEKDFRFPPPSLAVDHDFAPEEERAPSPREDPPSPINDSRCVDCIKADNVVNENAHSLQDWIISNCPHIEGFHPANLITPPSSYNGCYFDDYLRDNKKYLAPSNRQPKLQQPQQQQQRTKLGSDARSPIRLADFDPMKTDFSGKVVNGHSKCESPSLVTRLSPSQVVVTGSLRHEGPESVERNDDNPFDPESKGSSLKAQFKPELNRDDEPPKEGKYGSAPCVSGFGVMSGTSSASSSVAPVSDAAIDSPVSDGEAEKAAPVVDRLNGTLTRKFARGISAIADNRPLVFQARFQVMRDIQEDEASNSQYFVETPHYSFMLPDLRSYPVDFQQFLRKDLVETSSLVSLENAGRLNWWVEKGAGQTLLPLATSGDGNCLLHAASLGMWGFHDRLLTLRKALHHTLTSSSSKGALWRRWRWNQTLQNKQIHLVYSDAIWEEEWNGLVKLSSTTPRSKPESSSSSANKGTSPKLMGGGGSAAASLSTSSVHNTSNSSNAAPSDPVSATAVVDSGATKGVAANADHGAVENSETSTSAATAKTTTKENDSTFYESLEEFHVFVLAHVLRRPIIVVADTMLKDSNGDPFQPIHFGGVYLPLECPPSTCKRSPLVLSYDAAHFSAVVAMEGHAPHDPADESRKLLPVVVPLVAPDFNLLPLHFAVDPGEDFDWEKETKNPKIAKKLVLSTKEKLDLLLKYLDIVRIPLPKSAKTGTLNKKTPNGVATKQAESEKFVSNSIWGNDEKSAYGQVDFDSTQNGRDKDQELQVNGFDEPDRVHFESSPSTTASETSRIVKDRVVNPIAPTAASSSTLPPVYPHRNSSSSSSSTSSNHLRSNLLVTGLGSIGRSVTKKIKRNFGGIIGSGGSSRSSGKKSTPVTTPTNGVDVEATSEEVKKWHDIATVERRKEGIDETDNASGQPKTTKQKQTMLDFRRRRSSSAERKLPSSVFGCTQVPDDDVDCHRTDAYHCANATGSGDAAGGGEGKGDEAKVGEVTFIKKASPLGHRRLQSADANCGILAVKEESANYGSGAKTLPKSMAAGVESRNRKIGAALRNPFSTLERQKSKGEMKPPPAPSLSPNSIGDPNFLVAAKFCTNKRHEYQNEMLQNYLQNVRERFEEDKRSANKSGAIAGNATLRKNPRDVESTTITTDGESTVPILRQGQASSLQTGAETTVDSVSKRLEPSPTSSAIITSVESATKPPPSSLSSSSAGNRVQCITNNCTSYGSSASSYLCNTCFTKHKEEAVSLEKDIQLRGSNSRLNSPVKRQPLTATANSTSSALPKRTGSSSNLLNVKNSNNATFSSLPRRK